MEPNKSFITLISKETDLKKVKILGESFKDTESKFPFIIAITEDIYPSAEKDLQCLGLKTIKVTKLSEKNKNASIISLFGLEDYEKLVYVNPSLFINDNIDFLMDYPDMSLISYNDKDKLRDTRIMVICPQYHNAGIYKSLIESGFGFDLIISSLWSPSLYNKDYAIPRSIISDDSESDSKIYDFSEKEITNKKLLDKYSSIACRFAEEPEKQTNYVSNNIFRWESLL